MDMDKKTVVLLERLLEKAAADVDANGFARASLQLDNPTRERIRYAGEYLVERAAEKFPALDLYVSSDADGTIDLILDRLRTR